MRDMMSVILEGTLDAEMDEELGYSKHDYKNKEADNSARGILPKSCTSITARWKSIFQEIAKGIRTTCYQNTVTQDITLISGR